MYATPTYRPGPLRNDERHALRLAAELLHRQSGQSTDALAHKLDSIADGASTETYPDAAAAVRERMHEFARRSDPEYWAQGDDGDFGVLGADMIQVWVAENQAAAQHLRSVITILETAPSRMLRKTPVTTS